MQDLIQEKKVINKIADEIPHKNKILTQIERCNAIFSGFSPELESIDPRIERYSFVKGGLEGSKISLSVLTLLANAESILPLEFYEHLKQDNKYITAFDKTEFVEDGKTITGYKFLSKDPHVQYEGLLDIWRFYKELLNAIYSLEDFSDIKLIYNRRKIDYSDLEDEEAVFE